MDNCESCKGISEHNAQCDFCNKWNCDDCLEIEDFLGTGWKCCMTCTELIEEYADQEGLEMVYDNTEMFMLEMSSRKKVL